MELYGYLFQSLIMFATFIQRVSGYRRKLLFYGREWILTFYDSILLVLGITDHSLLVASNPKTTILISGKDPNFRVLKYVKWLHKTGKYDFILAVHQSSKLFDVDTFIFSLIVKYRNAVHLQRLMQYCNADLAIAFTATPSYALPVLNQTKIPTIFDPYDCLVVYYGTEPHLSWMQKEVPIEGACFALTKNVLARNLEAKQSMLMHHVVPKPSILFSDYCDNDNLNNRTPVSITATSPISLVYSGGLYGKSARKSSHGIENFDDLVASLNPNQIDLHLYPNPTSPPEYYYDYAVQAQSLPLLHLHTSVSQKQLAEELSTYHFGILPHFKDPDSRILDYKLKYGTSNKFFNFLEAGIPIIVSDEMTYMAWMVQRYKIGIVISRHDLAHLRAVILKSDYAQLQKNVLEVRQKLSMKSNIDRLVRFIDTVR